VPFPRHTLADADALVAAAGFASTSVDAAEHCVDCRRWTRRKIVDGVFYCSAPAHVRHAIEVARIVARRVVEMEAIADAAEPVEYLPEATATITGSGAYVPDADEVEAIAARYGIPADSIETTAVETLLDEVDARADAEHAAGLVHLMSDDLLDACGTAAPGGLNLAPFTTPERITCPACLPLAEEERRRTVEADHAAALADTATGTDADRVTITARASELRRGDLVVDCLGNRQYAAFDVDPAVPGDSRSVMVWTAVSDQERGLAPVIRLNAGRELLVSRRLTPEQQVEAAELFGS
jgi:hypothetical protein